MDALGTVEHDYRTPRLDSDKRRAAKAAAERAAGKRYNLYEYVGDFQINPKWKKCYGGSFWR